MCPTAGQGSVTFGSFFVPQNGSISVTFGVTIPNTATVGTYHNPAGAIFLDPTRNPAGGRMVAMATNVNANRSTRSYSSNTSFQSGGTTTIPGSHHSGLVAGPDTDDVVLLADLSITKTAPATAAVGSTFSYTLTPRNNGRALGTYTFAQTQATPLANGAAVGAAIGAAPLTLTDTLPDGMRMTTTFTGTGWTCSGTATAVCTLPAATAFPRAAATNFPTLSGVVSPICGDSGVKVNTVQIQQATGALITGNNIATVTTTISPACATATLTVSKNSSPTGSLLAASTVSYTLTVANLGPSAAPGTMVTDQPGAGEQLHRRHRELHRAGGHGVMPGVAHGGGPDQHRADPHAHLQRQFNRGLCRDLRRYRDRSVARTRTGMVSRICAMPLPTGRCAGWPCRRRPAPARTRSSWRGCRAPHGA